MAHDSTTGKISAPVSISDIQQAIGQSSGDLATLCKASTINMWAKYKPVQLYQVIDTTSQWLAASNRWKKVSELGGVDPWWYGLSGQFGGITAPGQVSGIPGYTDRASLIAAFDGNLNGWVYNQPTNGSLHPFRETDFAMYNHMAPAAVENFYVPNMIVNDGRFFASALMSMPDESADYLSLLDFKSAVGFSHVYFGVAVLDSQGNWMCRATSENEGEAGVEVDLSHAIIATNKNYKVYPFLSNQVLSITQTLDPSGLKMLPCPNCNYESFTSISRNNFADISLAAEYDRSDSTKIKVTIMNGDQTPRQNSYLYLMPITYWNNPGPNVGYAVKSYTNFTLPQSSQAFVYTFTQVPAGEYFIYATFANGTYWRKTNILEPYAPQT